MRKTMNRTTVIVVLVIFLCLSVGYALFSDTITIEGTATAQGNFDIEATCYTTIPEEVIAALDESIISNMESSPNNGYNSESCVVSDDKVTYSVGLEYPGAKKWYAVKFTNVGSIDSKILDSTFLNFETSTVKIYDSTTDELINTLEGNYFFDDEIELLWEKEDGNFINPSNLSEGDLAYIADTSDENNVSYLIKAGASLYLIMEVDWPNSDNFSQDGVYYEAIQTVEFPFEQYNG